MVFADLNRNFTLTLATGPVYGTTQFQRVALLRQTKRGAGSSQLTVCWRGWKSTKNIDGCFCFFEVYALFSPLYQQVGKHLFSLKSVVLMYVECTIKPFKHFILTKDRNRLSDAKGAVMFRAGQNLKHLHHARTAIKGKVYTGVVGTDSTHDEGENADTVSQTEVDDEILD
jgi:hypothetical protein